MFWDDILLVTQLVEKYGLQGPMVDLGGLATPTISDYTLTIKSGNQDSRYISLKQRPFDHICRDYSIVNPETGAPPIEKMAELDYFGCAVCLSVLEHTENPFDIFDGIYRIMKQGGLSIISTEFSFPYHPGPIDFWRFSPDCLQYLATKSGFSVLESGFRLDINGSSGILDHRGRPQEIQSVYIAMVKGELPEIVPSKFGLPIRYSKTGEEV